MNDMNDVERILTRVKPRAPRPELRRRIMTAAARPAVGPPVWERLWRSRAFWTAAAACLVAALFLTQTLAGPVKPAASARGPSAEAVELAETLVAGLGNGDALAHRFARQLSGQPAYAQGDEGLRDLLEEIQWQG